MKFAIIFLITFLFFGCIVPDWQNVVNPVPPQPDPPPVPQQVITCSDSDGGINYNVKGTATNGTLTQTDVCSGDDVLEYSCVGNDIYKLSQYCMYGCSDGHCVSSTPPSQPSSTCTDSDGGSNFNVKGTATNGTFTLTDICEESSVVEYVCQGSAIYEILQTCNYGCSDGKCNSGSDPSACTDSDGGQDLNVKGIAAKGTLIMADTCNGSSILEYFCSGNDMYELSQPCTYGCSNGKCNSASDPTSLTCTDSDGGINYAVKGTTTSGSNVDSDFCSSGNTKLLYEYYCKADGTSDFEFYTCPVTCSDGKCTTSSTPSSGSECTTNAGCGYKKRCLNGKCISVQCTSSSQCSGCKKCSSYKCVNCGYGASGYCTC
ncbi:MAG: hypothetical protein ABID61_00560 [Candidatus Micrarchaeota archaeon]